MKHKDLAIDTFTKRFKSLGHKIGEITFNSESFKYEQDMKDPDISVKYLFSKSIEYEYYNCTCPVCKYVAVLSIVNGEADVFRVDDDKGILAHKPGSLKNEFSICPRLVVME